MGRKRNWTGQYIYLYAVLLMGIGLLIESCACPPTAKRSPEEIDVQEHLVAAQHYLAVRDYDASMRESETVLALSSGKPPADDALFVMGLTYASPGNRKKDYNKAIILFTRVSRDYPQSVHAGQAKVWIEALQEDIQLKQAATETQRENDRLRKVLEESKKIDLDIGEKMRGKAR